MDGRPTDPRRRRVLQAGALGLAATMGHTAPAGAMRLEPLMRPSPKQAPRRIAFGSCCDQDQPQPIWEAIIAAEPELFIFLGDNIYGDTRDMSVLTAKYTQLAASPGFRRLRERTAVLATWDDHDFGENDAGGDYPMKEESRRIFCDFWGEPADSPRRSRDGIYTAVTLGPPGKRLQILLPDLRFNRTGTVKTDMGGKDYKAWAQSFADAGQEVPGYYLPNPAHEATMLGERQWQWLEKTLREPADVRLFASSLQVLADFSGWEAWRNFGHDHQRLIDVLRRTRAEGFFCISGDTHYAELSCLDVNVPYPLWDLTSSGLTEVWPVTPPNANRVSEVLREQNFGLIEIDWASGPDVHMEVRDVNGTPRIRHRLRAQELRPST